MSKVYYVKGDFNGVCKDTPSVLVGNEYFVWDRQNVVKRVMETLNKDKMPILLSEDVEDGIQAMKDLEIENIYVMIAHKDGFFSLAGQGNYNKSKFEPKLNINIENILDMLEYARDIIDTQIKELENA